MDKHDKALTNFREGYRCSQAVLSAYASEFDIDESVANKISICLAGGSGVGGECGAVSAAYLVIGLKYGFSSPGGHDEFGLVMEKNQDFISKFREKHGDIDCPKLINLDIFSEEGFQTFIGNNIKETVCTDFVSSAIHILDELLDD